MSIEVLSRLRLPISPVDEDEVARLADVSRRAVNVDVTRPDDPDNGTLWFDTAHWRLMMFYGAWFQLL